LQYKTSSLDRQRKWDFILNIWDGVCEAIPVWIAFVLSIHEDQEHSCEYEIEENKPRQK